MTFELKKKNLGEMGKTVNIKRLLYSYLFLELKKYLRLY
jgi:hypothetical protein